MKTILLSIILLCVCGLADEESNRLSSKEIKQDLKIEALHLDIYLVVLPTTNRIAKGDDVDLNVYVVNDSSQAIDCPPSTDIDHDGYSDTPRTLFPRCFRFNGQELESFGDGHEARLLTDMGQSRIGRNMSKHYKFKWKCSSENFDVITLDVELFIAGKLRRGTVTFLPKRQQVGAGQPATRPESKSEGSDKLQPNAEGSSR
jgi:hypothetical protein